MSPPRLTPAPVETWSSSSLVAARNLVACHCPPTLTEFVFLGFSVECQRPVQAQANDSPMLEPQISSD